jgi:hypothetical protein
MRVVTQRSKGPHAMLPIWQTCARHGWSEPRPGRWGKIMFACCTQIAKQSVGSPSLCSPYAADESPSSVMERTGTLFMANAPPARTRVQKAELEGHFPSTSPKQAASTRAASGITHRLMCIITNPNCAAISVCPACRAAMVHRVVRYSARKKIV